MVINPLVLFVVWCFTQLDVTTLQLQEEFGSRVFFPDAANSHFMLPDDFTRLVVEGSPQAQGLLLRHCNSSYPYRPFFQCKAQTVNVKVICASMKQGTLQVESESSRTMTRHLMMSPSQLPMSTTYAILCRRGWEKSIVHQLLQC